MNKFLLITVLIAVLIVGSLIGGLLYLGVLGNVELNNYAGNGVSFKYPADYNITEVNNNSTFLIAKNTKNPDLKFQVSKSSVNGDVYHGMNLDEYYNTLVNDFKSRGWITMLSNTTIDGSNAYSIDYLEKMQPDPDSVNGHVLMFDQNGIRYTLEFKGKGKQIQDNGAIFQVEITFKVL
jgi:hypothetical protein